MSRCTDNPWGCGEQWEAEWGGAVLEDDGRLGEEKRAHNNSDGF